MARRSELDAPSVPGAADQNRRISLSIYDVAPTILAALGVQTPEGMGRATIGPAPSHTTSAYTPDEEAELARRLEELGYL